jgi:NDP-sugar pyrophosphorylase family protein
MSPSGNKIKKGMILAAGLGTRLRPLTYKIPKPLITLNNHRLIDYPLNYLSKNGVGEVIINLHHLGDKIRDYVGTGERYNLKVSYSEEPQVLGTGGGIKKAGDFFDGKPFVCINADSLIHADFNALVERHFSSQAAATMVLKKRSKNDPYEGLDINDDGTLKKIGEDGDYFYTGLQILTKELLDALPPSGTVSCLIQDGYRRLLENGKKIAVYLYDGYFNDLGTPDRYEIAKKDIMEIQSKFEMS